MTKYLNTRDGSIEDAAVKTVEQNITFKKEEIKIKQPVNRYLNTRDTSLEAAVTKVVTEETEYQQMFKKELEKAGKAISQMSDAEKKAFFNKIDSKYKAKNEGATDKEIDKFHKSLDKIVHKSFGHSSDEKKKEMNKEAVDNPYAVGMAAAMKSTGDKPPLKKSTITKAHDIAKSIEKDQKKEGYEGKSYKSYKEMKKEADIAKNMKKTMTDKPVTDIDVEPKTDSLAGYTTNKQ